MLRLLGVAANLLRVGREANQRAVDDDVARRADALVEVGHHRHVGRALLVQALDVLNHGDGHPADAPAVLDGLPVQGPDGLVVDAQIAERAGRDVKLYARVLGEHVL